VLGQKLGRRLELWGNHFARRRVPLRRVGFFPEMRRQNVRLREVLRIVQYSRQRDPLPAEVVVAIEVLGENGILTVGNTISPDVTRPKIRGYNLKATARSRSCASRSRKFPTRLRRSLPGRRARRWRISEME